MREELYDRIVEIVEEEVESIYEQALDLAGSEEFEEIILDLTTEILSGEVVGRNRKLRRAQAKGRIQKLNEYYADLKKDELEEGEDAR